MNTAYQTTLPLLTSATASSQGAPLLESAHKKLGFVPNMYGAMVNSPGLLETYQLGYERFRASSGFTPAEQEVVLLTISFENGCDYCMAAHSFLADNMSKVPKAVTDAIRTGTAIPAAKLAALTGMLVAWKNYLERQPFPVTHLHRDEFRAQFPAQATLAKITENDLEVSENAGINRRCYWAANNILPQPQDRYRPP